MKAAIYIRDGETQIVLTPENEHEKSVLRLADAKTISHVYRGSFYDCQGGWVRQGPGDDSLIVVLENK